MKETSIFKDLHDAMTLTDNKNQMVHVSIKGPDQQEEKQGSLAIVPEVNHIAHQVEGSNTKLPPVNTSTKEKDISIDLDGDDIDLMDLEMKVEDDPTNLFSIDFSSMFEENNQHDPTALGDESVYDKNRREGKTIEDTTSDDEVIVVEEDNSSLLNKVCTYEYDMINCLTILLTQSCCLNLTPEKE